MAMQLAGKVCVVTGASRSVGQAIAVELGRRGATVYVTGRSIPGAVTSKFAGDSIDDTAALVNEAGGQGVPVALDQRDDAQVEALFARVDTEQGRLDILVNNAWAGYEGYDDTFTAPFWEQPLARWDRMAAIGVRSTMVTSVFAARRMLAQQSGLIVNTTVPTPPDNYLGSAFYDTAKTAINRITYTTGRDLAGRGVQVVGVAPGWLRTKIIYDMYKTDPEHWQEVGDLVHTESTAFAARAIATLATAADRARWHGRTLTVAQLARFYGFTDVDGRQPDFYREVMGIETDE